MLKKLITLVMSIFLIICAGTCNYYPLYLSNIMTKYSYSKNQAYLFASFIHLGYWFLFPLGFIYDHFGPGISLIIACVCLPGSYTILNIMIMMVKSKIHIAPMVILGFIMGQGSALCFLVSITTNLYNFGENANLISGILITNQAITPSLFTSYEKTMNDKTESDDYEFIIFIGLILATVIAVGAWLVQIEPPVKPIKHNQSSSAIELEIAKTKEENIKKFNEYKENKVCLIFGVLNVLTLFLFVIGMIYNNKTSKSKLPIMYFLPVLQVVNVVLIILEKCKVWDKIMMKYYIKANLHKKNTNNESKERKENNSSLGNDELSKKKEDDKIIIVDVDSEKSIIEKKMNLSFNYQKRINDLKVKYEIDPIQNQLNDNNNNNNNNNNLDILNQIFEQHNNYNKNENTGTVTNNNNNNNLGNNYPLITYFISNSSNNKEILYNNVINANQNDFLDVDRVFSSTNQQGEETRTVQHQPQIDQNNFISDSDIQIPKIEKREGYIETMTKNQNEISLCKILCTHDIIMIFCIILLGTGAASSLNNNIDLVIKSIKLNIQPSKINDFSIIYFAFDSFFRMVLGIILNWLFAKQRTNIFLIICAILGLISQLISSKMTQGILYANIIISGIINGSLITFIAAFVKNYSQKKHFGKVLGMLYSAVGFGKLLLSDFIFPSFSESFKKNEETCQGKQCFIYSFLLNALFNLIILIYLIVVIILNKKKKKQQDKKKQSHNNCDSQGQKNENSTS